MSFPRMRRATTVSRRLTTPLFALLLLVFTLAAVSAPATANPNTSIQVEVTGIENGSGTGGQLVVGDKVIVSGTWDATTATPQPDDTFTIGLPPEFGFEQNVPFTLWGEDAQGDPIAWAECETDPATGIATCTLTDAVLELPDEVQGTWEFEITVEEATTEEEVIFDLNGVDTPVELPGEDGIDPGVELPGEVTKSGAMNDNNWSMTWTVDIPGANLAAAGGDAHITDAFGSGHVLCDPTNFKVVTVNASGDVTGDVTNLVTSLPTAGGDGFDIVLTEPGAGWNTGVTYRITYESCTPDGQISDPNTTYSNSMEIEGWGEAGQGVGTITNKPWQDTLAKSGTVLGGGERNGKIAWTVTVPGSELLGKNSFTFSEALGAGHNVCADTLSNLKITERYGPSGQLDADVTGQLTRSGITSTADSFGMTFTAAPGFAFKDSDWRYLITYETCVTATDLPGGGTGYTNTATVDGKIAGTTAEVPGRKSDKTGKINTGAVTIDGVEHSPQTTLDWTVTIPGRQIEDMGLAGALSLVDTLSDSHQVCAAGDPTGGMSARLNLKVEARDQIAGGGLTTQDLTGHTTVTQDGQELTFSLAQTGLPLPGGGTSTGFSREYQYVFTYTTCTTSGGMDAPGTQYSNEIDGFGTSFKPTVTQSNRGSGTGTGKARGTVAVQKDLADTPGSAFVPVDTTFKVHVKEIDPAGVTATEYDLDVPLDGSPISGFNSRGTGWTFELSEPTLPNVPGVTWGAPKFAAGDGVSVNAAGTVATATIAPRSNISVQLTNTAQLGSITIVKAVEGPAAGQVATDRTYRVTAAIDTSALGVGFPSLPARQLDLVAGDPVTLVDLPIGATVDFTEARPADDDILTWGTPVISPASVTVTAEHASTPAQVTVTNSVSRTVGTFSLSKLVTGAQAANPVVPASVSVTATWIQDGITGSKVLSLPTDGTSVQFGENLLIGTKVTLTETPLIDGSSIAWGAPVWSGTGVVLDGLSAVVTIGRDANAAVTLTNHAATSVAGISLIKGIGGEAAGEVPVGTEFPVTATWTDADGEQSRDLRINAQTPTALGVDLPAGTVVTITEGERPGFPTVVWGSITVTGEDVTDQGDGSAEIVVSDQQSDVTLVTVTNEATWAPGTFSLKKLFGGITAAHADVPESFTVTASWRIGDEEQFRELTVPADGSVVALGEDLPHGTQVTLSETAPADTASFTWATPTWGGKANDHGDGTAVVTIGAATTAAVELTNVADDKLGSINLTKKLSGTGASSVPARTRFPVTLTWTDLLGQPQEREVILKAGKTATINNLPVGAKVTISEDAGDVGDLTWTGATWKSASDNVELTKDGDSAAVVTITGDDGASAKVTLTNGFNSPTGNLDDDRGNPLPQVGSDTSPWWVGLGVVGVLTGALLLASARRRRTTVG